MKYLDLDGVVHDTRIGSIFSSVRIGIHALKNGTFQDLVNMIKREDHPELVAKEHYDNAVVDWETGFVRMYNKRGVEIFSVKIDTNFYKQFAGTE